MGFAVIRALARHRMPLIQFLFIGSRVCSTLLTDPPRDEALALRYDFTSISSSKGLSPSSCRACSAHEKGRRAGRPFSELLLEGVAQ